MEGGIRDEAHILKNRPGRGPPSNFGFFYISPSFSGRSNYVVRTFSKRQNNVTSDPDVGHVISCGRQDKFQTAVEVIDACKNHLFLE